jgi:hypothetical protein
LRLPVEKAGSEIAWKWEGKPMAYERKTPKRGPRDEERALLEAMLWGPVPVAEGPLGRCLKRGWCRPAAHLALADAKPTFELTEEGRALILVALQRAA